MNLTSVIADSASGFCSLEGNKIGVEGAKEIAAALKINSTLDSLKSVLNIL